jgi:ribonucleoside-triphosphate reductase
MDVTAQKIQRTLSASNVQNSNANVNEKSYSGKRFTVASTVLKSYALSQVVSEEFVKANDENYIYIHDLDNLAIGNHNCLVADVDRLFKNGFKQRNGDCRPPKSISSAMQLLQVIFQSQSNEQFGGVAANHVDFTLAPYVQMSYEKHLSVAKEYGIADADKYAMERTIVETKQAAESFYHNLNTVHTRSGDQLAFTSINFGRDTSWQGRLVTKSLLEASIDGIGRYHTTSIFPISIFQYKKGINDVPGTPNYDLKQLAIKSLCKRIYPNFANCDWTEAHEDPDDIRTMFCTMGCRTMLGPDRFSDGKAIRDGRGNVSPVTVVLPKIAMESDSIDAFFIKLDNIIDVAVRCMVERFKYITSQSKESAPFMYGNQSILGFDGENIASALKHGTHAIGFIGLSETLTKLVGKNHVDSEARKLGLQIVERINIRAKEYSEKYNLNFSCYATPAESCCYTIMQKLKKEYGSANGIFDHDYLTNSFHIPVYQNIDLVEKIKIESEFTKYATGGTITYVELDGIPEQNPEAVEAIIDYAMMMNIPYFAINFPINTCEECGHSDNTMLYKCPKCGSDKIQHLARVTGYLSTDVKNMNIGKQSEVRERSKHISLDEEMEL